MSHLLRPLRRSGPVCTTCTRLLTASPTAGPSVCRSGVHTASQTSRGPSRRGPTNAQYAQARRARDDSGERKMDTSRVRFMAGRPAAPRSYMQNDRDADERPRTRGVGMRTVPAPYERAISATQPERLRVEDTPFLPEWKRRRWGEKNKYSIRVKGHPSYGLGPVRNAVIPDRMSNSPTREEEEEEEELRRAKRRAGAHAAEQPQFKPEPPPTVEQEDGRVRPFKDFSPPMLPGLLASIHELVGEDAQPTPIQAISLDYFFRERGPNKRNRTRGSSETLLAAETGSGKTLAYLMPVLQNLKETEAEVDATEGRKMNSPRALILAPTHELCRQLAQAVKQLTHIDKLRTVCFSNPLPRKRTKDLYDEHATPDEFEAHREGSRPADIVVGTPSKMLEMFRLKDAVEEQLDEQGEVVVRKDFGESQGLERVQWVVVDEADVLFGHDFRPATRALLHFVREARSRGKGESAVPEAVAHPAVEEPVSESAEDAAETTTDAAVAMPAVDATKVFTAPPFNLLLSTATVSAALGTQLAIFHPQMIQLLSPNLHKLPRTLKTEHVAWRSGNRSADVAEKIFSIWTEEAREKRLSTGVKFLPADRGKVLVFCNTSAHAEKLGNELRARAVNCIVLTSESDLRRRGSNHHLDGFLTSKDGALGPKPPRASLMKPLDPQLRRAAAAQAPEAPAHLAPQVLVTTSLLSRGLDFRASVKYVIIMDEPQNMIDFVHRAGRTGRAGQQGRVVLFGKGDKKSESPYIQEMRGRVRALAA